jgi:hypothetical protein
LSSIAALEQQMLAEHQQAYAQEAQIASQAAATAIC